MGVDSCTRGFLGTTPGLTPVGEGRGEGVSRGGHQKLVSVKPKAGKAGLAELPQMV